MLVLDSPASLANVSPGLSVFSPRLQMSPAGRRLCTAQLGLCDKVALGPVQALSLVDTH